MDRIDTLVIGAGVVGLAIGRALAQAGHDVLVLEAEAAIGQGVSARNSEVIHAGLYYDGLPLKSALCVRGKDLLYAYCAERGITHARCGKLVVATAESGHATLRHLQAQASAIGVPTEWLDAAAAQAREPALHCTAALFSPTTGIVDTHGLMLALQGDLEHAGGQVVCHTTVRGARFTADGAEVDCTSDDGEAFTLAANWVINAAGLTACALAQRFEGLAPAHIPTPAFAKGHYFSLRGRAPFSHLIYPVPEPGGLGTHLTLDLGGQARFGPDVAWLPAEPGSANLTAVAPPEQALDYTVPAALAARFAQAVRAYWPELPDDALQPDYSGIRPKISGPGQPGADFRIDGPAQHGVMGLVNLFGIESPGLTAALALGERVQQLVASARLPQA